MTTRLVVFDLDGTLIDSARDLADSVNALLGELGAAPLGLEEVTAMVGEGAAVLVRRALKAAGRPVDAHAALERFIALYAERLTNHTRPYPGIPETLDALRAGGRTLAVLTNKPQHATEEILERLDLTRWFDEVRGGDTTWGRKPDPAGLLDLVGRAGAVPSSTIMVGDSRVDVETAARAGTRMCVVKYGFGYRPEEMVFSGGETFVDTASELPSALA